MTALAGSAAGAALAGGASPQPCGPCGAAGRLLGRASGRRSVAARAKRRIPSKHTSTAGGGGRGRSAPKDSSALRELSQALQGSQRQRDTSGRGGGSGGFGSKQDRAGGRAGSRGGRRQRQEDEESESGWDEELLADLSDSGEREGAERHRNVRHMPLRVSGPRCRLLLSPSASLPTDRRSPCCDSSVSPAEVAELIGEEGETADVLAGADPQLRAAVEQVSMLLLSLTQCRGVLPTAT